MDRFSFTLEVVGIDPGRDDYESVLFEAGCDDALIAVVNNKLVLDFDREAESYDSAVSSAKQNVAAAGGKVVAVHLIEDRR
jgi:hypothetical protein